MWRVTSLPFFWTIIIIHRTTLGNLYLEQNTQLLIYSSLIDSGHNASGSTSGSEHWYLCWIPECCCCGWPIHRGIVFWHYFTWILSVMKIHRSITIFQTLLILIYLLYLLLDILVLSLQARISTCRSSRTILPTKFKGKGSFSYCMVWVALVRHRFALNLLKKILTCKYFTHQFSSLKYDIFKVLWHILDWCFFTEKCWICTHTNILKL